MPSIKSDGLDDVFAMLKRLGASGEIEGVQKQAVYAGMAVVCDEVVDQIEHFPVQNGYIESDKLPRNVVTDREKRELLKHLGIASMDNKNGTVSTRISFDGYTDIKTKAYPNGLPAVMVARSINSGSSVRQKHPFIRAARAAAKDKAVVAAEKAAREALDKIVEG
jgi:hypothetical protein